MAINKVVYGNNVLVDLTEDTVSPDNLQSGATAHSRSGALIRGTASMGGAAPCSVIAANSFDVAINYKAGDYCLYNGGLYRFIVNHTGSWRNDHVIQITLASDMTYLKRNQIDAILYALMATVNITDKATIIEDKVYDAFNHNEFAAGYGRYMRFTVRSLDKYFIVVNTWDYGGGRFPSVVFLDSNGNELDPINLDAGLHRYVICKVPDGAVTLIANGSDTATMQLFATNDDMPTNSDQSWGLNTIRSLSYELENGVETPYLSDLNDAEVNTIIRLHVYGDGKFPRVANVPNDYLPSEIMAYLITFGRQNGSLSYKCQILMTDNGYIWTRVASSQQYLGWVRASNGPGYITIKPTDDVVQKFMDALTLGVNDVYIQAGDYDVIQLYKNHFGTDYFADYQEWYNPISGDMNFGRGIKLSNNIHYHFSPYANFHANYTGENQNVTTYFSMFSGEFGKGGYIVDDLNITECTNLRYAFHDDYDIGENYLYGGLGHFKNCRFVCNNRAIGSGLRNGCTLKIEDCYFETVNNNPVNVHTPNPDGQKGYLIVTGNYFNNELGLIRGNGNTAISNALITNNSYRALDADTDYWNVTEYNNNIHE